MAKGIDGGDYVVNNVHYCIQGCNLKMAKNCLDERVHFSAFFREKSGKLIEGLNSY